MKIIIYFILLSLLTLGSLSAQIYNVNINPYPPTNVLFTDTVRILSVMVSFQEDKDASTFGNGKFGSMYSRDYGNSILDPLPHDRKYFENHLEFVKNYFKKVSNSKLHIEYYVLPDTFSVSKTMRNYSPPPKSNDIAPLGEFAKEVWALANQLYPDFQFSNYDLFVIFHAGVGRDVSLPGSLGNERDLPSLYLSENALKSIFGPNFNGFPVQNGSFKIKNSAIIPSTESRELESIGGKVLIELTINGLLAATVASHLGLPDLFDTQTGLSAIGRFGLMDGQSIFAYNGCFPPEPSAWEKIFLGWIQPEDILVISPSQIIRDVSLPTKLIANNQPYIVKVPINSNEYFLIENKQRDALKNGSIVKYRIRNQEFTKTFIKDTIGFRSYDTDSLAGVIIDVDEFDWAVPGNGILIWHIDEAIISQKISQNKINNDKKFRGVDVEEADGIQDIGEKFRTILGDEIIGEGTELDLWFAGNSSRFYKNRFDKNSRPSTHSNSGANSLISIYDFSQKDNIMSFKVSFIDSIIKPLYVKQINTTNKIGYITSPGRNFSKQFFLAGRNLIISDSSSTDSVLNFSDYKPLVIEFAGKLYVIGATYDSRILFPSRVNYIEFDGNNYNVGGFALPYSISNSPVFYLPPTERHLILLPTFDGKILSIALENLTRLNPPPYEDFYLKNGYQIIKISANDGFSAIARKQNSNSEFSLIFEELNIDLSNIHINDLLLTNYKNQKVVVLYFVQNGERKINVYNKSGLLFSFNLVPLSSDKIILSDLKQDGNPYIITSKGNQIYAFNIIGALANNFPFTIKDDEFNGWILSADIEGDNKQEIIAFTKNGNIYAINGATGKLVDGFPISTGNNNLASPSLFTLDNSICLSVVDIDNNYYSWKISNVASKIDWAELNANNLNQSFLKISSSPLSNFSLLPDNKAYNYPNPVYESTTAIRFFVSENADVTIKIYDLAGDKVDELKTTAIGGFDNEVIWNVTSIQSGIYLAKIEAKSITGKIDSKIIKIAVVK